MAFTLKANGGASSPPDLAQIRRALTIFVDQEHYVFLQSLPDAAWACLAGIETTQIEEWIVSHATGTGFYFGINPVNHVSKPTKVGDVVKRRWILIDVDRNKTLQPNDPATENEHDDSKELAFEVQTYLAEIGFPAPVQIDSGNGFHLYYRIDLPNDEAHRDLVHGFLKILDNTFSGDKGEIDHGVFDARRISRMPGTWSRKGAASKDRPYRQCKIIYSPKEIGIVPAELLRRVVDDHAEFEANNGKTELNGKHVDPPPQERIPDEAFKVKATGEAGRDKAYGRAAIENETALLNGCPAGRRHKQLYKSACNLWELHAGGCLESREVIDGLFIAACNCGLDKDQDYGEAKIIKTINDAREKVTGKARNATSQPDKDGKSEAWKTIATGTVDEAAQRSKLYSLPELLSLEIPDPRWAVPGILSEGLTLLAGAPKQGKSWLALNLAITIAAGGHALGDAKVAPGDVLYLCLEDRLRRVKFRAAKILTGIGCEASARLKIAVEWPRMDKGGMEKIAEWAKSVQNPTLFIIDVWQKFKPVSNGRSKNQYEEDYQFSTILKGFADSIGASGVAIHHTKKSKSEDWLEDVSGTLGLAGAADGVLVLQRSRGETEAKLCMTGRDIDEKELALRFNPDTAVWTSEGIEGERTKSKIQNAILDMMKSHPGATYSSAEMASILGMDPGSVRTNMLRMAEKGIIEKFNSRYRYPVETDNATDY